jgi:hypothetical protein
MHGRRRSTTRRAPTRPLSRSSRSSCCRWRSSARRWRTRPLPRPTLASSPGWPAPWCACCGPPRRTPRCWRRSVGGPLSPDWHSPARHEGAHLSTVVEPVAGRHLPPPARCPLAQVVLGALARTAYYAWEDPATGLRPGGAAALLQAGLLPVRRGAAGHGGRAQRCCLALLPNSGIPPTKRPHPGRPRAGAAGARGGAAGRRLRPGAAAAGGAGRRRHGRGLPGAGSKRHRRAAGGARRRPGGRSARPPAAGGTAAAPVQAGLPPGGPAAAAQPHGAGERPPPQAGPQACRSQLRTPVRRHRTRRSPAELRRPLAH